MVSYNSTLFLFYQTKKNTSLWDWDKYHNILMKNELKSHFLNLYLLALSDNDFDETELNTILKIGEEKGVSKEEFEKLISNPINVDFHTPESFMEKIELLYDFSRIIWADKRIDEEEINTFMKFCKRFNFEEEESKELFEWLIDLAKKDCPNKELKNEIKKLIN